MTSDTSLYVSVQHAHEVTNILLSELNAMYLVRSLCVSFHFDGAVLCWLVGTFHMYLEFVA